MVRALMIPGTNDLSVRTNTLRGRVEWEVITSLSGLGLNSFPGGWRCEFIPSARGKNLVEAAVVM